MSAFHEVVTKGSFRCEMIFALLSDALPNTSIVPHKCCMCILDCVEIIMLPAVQHARSELCMSLL